MRILDQRAEDSRELDAGTVPFVAWERFRREYVPAMRQGEHITLVGRTGSGKTTLAVGGLLQARQYVVVLATKAQDTSLYEPLVRKGYVITDDPRLDIRRTPRVIFRPRLAGPSKENVAAQAEAFRALLLTVYNEGGWALYMDEIRYLSDTLKLTTELETLWLQGRSLGVTMIAATQNPVSIPLVAFDQAEHLFLWRQTDRYRVERMAEFAGTQGPTVKAVIPSLPDHEALYVRVVDDTLARTRYQR